MLLVLPGRAGQKPALLGFDVTAEGLALRCPLALAQRAVRNRKARVLLYQDEHDKRPRRLTVQCEALSAGLWQDLILEICP